MTDELWAEAERLASRNYRVEFERDYLSSGQVVYMARNPNLPGCKAQGATMDEAQANLDDARIDYIYALLDEGLPVPEPLQPLVEQSGNVTIINFSFGGTEQNDLDEILEQVIQPEQREFMFGLTLGGDLVKHG